MMRGFQIDFFGLIYYLNITIFLIFNLILEKNIFKIDRNDIHLIERIGSGYFGVCLKKNFIFTIYPKFSLIHF